MKIWWSELDKTSKLILQVFGGMVLLAILITTYQCVM